MNDNKINIPNIVIYTTSDFPNGGAPENFVRQMVDGIYENQIAVSVVRLRGQLYGDTEHKVKVSNFINKKFPENEFLKFVNLISQIIYTPFSILIQKLKYKKNTIILYGVEYLYFTMPYLLFCKLFNIRLYRIVTDYYEPQSLTPVWWKKIKLVFYYGQFKFIDQYFNGVIVLSHYLKKIIQKNNVKNVLLINHFIDFSSFYSSSFKKVENTFVIGFCGTTNIQNGTFDLIDAFVLLQEFHPNTQLLIIGNFSSELKNKLNQLPDSIKNKITVTGFLEKSDVQQNLQKCDILVNPRIAGEFAEAGFPTKLGEYFAMKKPIVTTVTDDFKIYFENKKQVVFASSNNPTSIKDGLVFFIENPLESNKIANAGNQWGYENLDYIKNSKKLINFIKM
ncbi:glycosyltransferase [Flavobacterium branchiophilum]|uniref:Glycosyl transferase family 1 domain-containing protein n=1 Tax=Flavobacterium branchiophilum TaxID=55197 RepID=A0A2H3KGY7_9FLAO|nr:glycosyltransferase [Flavobacterium branchiophilum]PDS23144.1 hypothetical protein B0A77_11555 [Flavobacterium branchiophilum]